jgi:hypothetical protein
MVKMSDCMGPKRIDELKDRVFFQKHAMLEQEFMMVTIMCKHIVLQPAT